MAGNKRIMQFKRYPWIKAKYIIAFDRMLIAREDAGLETDWLSGQEVFDWWMSY